mmetsp:Transcript_151/g.244  ORF Transcript_151/g.244 Transcript_151/m.244 type:complete len:194 (-) Transcript_151:7-588(-)
MMQAHRMMQAQHSRPSVRCASGRAMSISPISRKVQRGARQGPGRVSTTPKPKLAVPEPSAAPAADILEAFFFGRAFAAVFSRRVSEVLVDFVAEVSKSAAERPQRIQAFQEEVALMARKEMAAASGLPDPGLSAPAGPSYNSSSNGTGGSVQRIDSHAAVDELRAEVAYARALLMQMKTGGKSSGPPGPPPCS